MDDDFFDSFIPITKKRNSRMSCSQSTFSSTLNKQKTLSSFLKPRLSQIPSVFTKLNNVISNEQPLTTSNEGGLLYKKKPETINYPFSSSISNTVSNQKVISSQLDVPKVEPDELINYCPTCQIPFKILNVQPHVHAVACRMSWFEMEECSLGEKCNINNVFHYKDYSHKKLAQLRASKRSLEKDSCENNISVTAKRLCTPKKKVYSDNYKKTVFETHTPIRKYNVGLHALQHEKNNVSLSFKNNRSVESEPNDDIPPKNISMSSQSTCILNGHKEACISPIDIFDKTTISNVSLLSTSLSTDFNVEQALDFNLQPDLLEGEPANHSLNVSKTLSFKGNIVYKEKEKICNTKDQRKNCVTANTVSCKDCMCTKNRDKSEEIETCIEMTLTPPSKETITDLLSPVKVQLQYSELGWQTLGINCQPEVCVQEVTVSLCDCSHCMQVECTVTGTQNSGKETRENADSVQSKIYLNLDELGLHKKNGLRPINYISDLKIREMSIVSNFNSNGGSSTALAVAVPSDDTTETSRCKGINNSAVDLDVESISSVNSADIREVCDKANALYSKNDVAKQKWKELMVSMKRKGLSSMSVMSDDSLSVSSYQQAKKMVKSHGKQNWRPSGGNKQCPFYKKIPDTSFVVDAFQYGIIPGATHYFLTHFHADHYGGLKKAFNKPIICTAITALLVKKKLGVESRYLNIIQLENPRVIRNVTVTALDANHCPGSVMFLFQLMDGRNFLHVGDFRADPSMESFPCFWNLNIDILFLDTTYCNPRYTFPTQAETIAKVVDITMEYIKKHPFTLVVSGTYTIGKEKVFMGIAEALDCKVWANKEKRKVLECLADPTLTARLADNPWEARVHVWSMMDLNPNSLRRHLNQCRGKFQEVLAFKPSGWELQGKGQVDDFKFHTENNVTIYCVPYSEHSSFTELQRFVKFLKPAEILPTVNMGTEASRKSMQGFFHKWLSEPHIPSRPIQHQQKLTSFLAPLKGK